VRGWRDGSAGKDHWWLWDQRMPRRWVGGSFNAQDMKIGISRDMIAVIIR